MLLTDHEWLRFVSFGLLAGGIVGAANAGALLVGGWPLKYALVGAVGFVGALALVVHAIVRYLLDAATAPPDDADGGADTEEATA
jgi:hypothetical protein